MNRVTRIAALPALASLLLGCASTGPAADRPVDCPKQLRQVKQVVDDFWSFTLFKVNAFDLEGQAQALSPDARAAADADACADVLDRFIASLGDGHANLIYFPGRTPRSVPEGIELRRFSERLVRAGESRASFRVHVVEVSDSLAEAVDLRVGDEVTAIDGRPVAEAADHIAARMSASTPWGREQWTDRALLRGPAGSTAVVTVRRGAQVRDIELRRPPMPVSRQEREAAARMYEDTVTVVEDRTLDGGWGYINLKTFGVRRATEAFDEALARQRDAPGLVLDVRGNGGGYVVVLEEIAGRLLPAGSLIAEVMVREPGTSYVYKDIEPMRAERRDWVYEGPLVLLTDAGCFSACDLLSNGLNEAGRALIIGSSPTGGGSASPIGQAVFPEWDGVAVRTSFFVALRGDGTHIEGRGIAPRVRLEPRLADYVAGRDRLLERAVRALEDGEAPALNR